MKLLKPYLSIFCVFLLLTPLASGQQATAPAPEQAQGTSSSKKTDPDMPKDLIPISLRWTPATGGKAPWLTGPYRQPDIAPVSLENSPRLEALIRGGNLYLSLQDAIALALENNLDIELSRYNPQLARVDLLRAKAGGLLRGVPTAVQAGPTSAFAIAAGGATGGIGGGARGSSAGGQGVSEGGVGGAVITQTGVAIPNLDPQLFAQYGFSHNSRPQSNTITTGRTALVFDNHSYAMGYQQNFLTGSTVSLGWNNLWNKSNNPFSDLNPARSANLNLQFTQRLLQGFGLAVNNRNIKVAKNDLKVADLVFQQQVIATVAAVENLYWDLVSFNENVGVKKQAVSLAEKLYSDNKKQVEIGTLAPIEVVRAEAEVARAQQDLTVAETQVMQQETILKNVLSRNGVASPTVAMARIVAADRIRMPEFDRLAPLQELSELALKMRPEIQQQQLNIMSTKIQLAGSKSQLLPSLDFQAAFQNNGLAGTVNTVPIGSIIPPHAADPYFIGGWPGAMAQVFRRNFPDYSAGFQLSIPIRNRVAQADYIRDQLTLRQQELRYQSLQNDIRVSVQNAVIGLQQARAAYDTAVKQRVLQEQSLDAEQKKYALGASTIFFVIQSQRDLAQARFAEVQALSTYGRARVELNRVTGQILEANSIQIEEAMRGRVARQSTLPPAD